MRTKELLLSEINSYEGHVREHPEKSLWHYAKAKTFIELAELTGERSYYNEAITSYTQVINLSPQNKQYLTERSEVYIILKKFDLAVQDIIDAKKAPSTGGDFLDMCSNNTIENILKLPAVNVELNKLVETGKISSAELKTLFPSTALEHTELGSRVSDYDAKGADQESQDSKPMTRAKLDKVKQDNQERLEDFKLALSQMQLTFSQIQSSRNKLQQNKTKLQQNKTKLQQNKTELQKIKTSFQLAEADLQKSQADMQETETALQETETALQKNDGVLQKQEVVQQYKTKLQKIKTSFQLAEADLQEKKANLQKRQADLQKMETDMRETETDMQETETDMQETETNLQKEEGALKKQEAIAKEQVAKLELRSGAIKLYEQFIFTGDDDAAVNIKIGGHVNEDEGE